MIQTCDGCEEQFDGNPNEPFCKDCDKMRGKIRGNIVAGKWRVRDPYTRTLLASAIRENTPFEVWVKERVGDIYVYEPDRVDLSVGGKVEVY